MEVSRDAEPVQIQAFPVNYLGIETGQDSETGNKAAILYLAAMPQDKTLAFAMSPADLCDMMLAAWEALGLQEIVDRGPCCVCGDYGCDCDVDLGDEDGNLPFYCDDEN